MSTQYGAMLLDLLSCTCGDGGYGYILYDLGEGYHIMFADGDEGGLFYVIFHQGIQVMSFVDYLPLDRRDKPCQHTLAVARLMYAHRDAIVARYLAQLDAVRPAAEKRLAQEMQR